MWFSCFALTSRSSSRALRFWCGVQRQRRAPSLPPHQLRQIHPHLTALVPLQKRPQHCITTVQTATCHLTLAQCAKVMPAPQQQRN